MGQMVSEIAHQLNNPLVGVINLAELAEREIGNPARVKELLGQVRSAGEQCREYVQRVLQLSQLTRSERRPADINRLARDTVAFFQQSLGSHLSVDDRCVGRTTDCRRRRESRSQRLVQSDSQCVAGRPERDGCRFGRREATRWQAGREHCGVRPWARFSAGIGRQVVYTVLHDATRRHRARFVNRAAYCHSAWRNDQRREQARRWRKLYDVDSDDRGDKVKSKILLVDDDPYTQQLFEGLLRGEDIELHVAANIAEARNEFHLADFNLVLLDQRLPDGNGLDFFKELRALRPQQLAILITGHADLRDADRRRARRVVRLSDQALQKPGRVERDHRPRPRDGSRLPRDRQSSGDAGGAPGWSGHRWAISGDAKTVSADAANSASGHHGVDRGRERDWQGAYCQGNS